jgi:hypothetical protein
MVAETVKIELPKTAPIAIIVGAAIIWALKGMNEGFTFCVAMWAMYWLYLLWIGPGLDLVEKILVIIFGAPQITPGNPIGPP